MITHSISRHSVTIFSNIGHHHISPPPMISQPAPSGVMGNENPAHSIGISMDNLSTPHGALLSLSPRTGPNQQQQLMAASDSVRVIVSTWGSEQHQLQQDQGCDVADLGGGIVASGTAPGSVTLLSFSPYTGSGPSLLAISLGSALLCLRIELKPLLEHHRCGSFPCGSRPRWKAVSWCRSHKDILAVAHEVRGWGTGTSSGRAHLSAIPANIPGHVLKKYTVTTHCVGLHPHICYVCLASFKVHA